MAGLDLTGKLDKKTVGKTQYGDLVSATSLCRILGGFYDLNVRCVHVYEFILEICLGLMR